MSDLMTYLLARDNAEVPPPANLDALINQYAWFTTARRIRRATTGNPDHLLSLTDPWRTPYAVQMPTVDAAALTQISSEDIIDRFLCENNLRIVVENEVPEGDVLTEAEFSDEDDIVSEELAAIYLAQGLFSRAIDIYRKLSLLNPEKSVYFAELITKIENNN